MYSSFKRRPAPPQNMSYVLVIIPSDYSKQNVLTVKFPDARMYEEFTRQYNQAFINAEEKLILKTSDDSGYTIRIDDIEDYLLTVDENHNTTIIALKCAEYLRSIPKESLTIAK